MSGRVAGRSASRLLPGLLFAGLVLVVYADPLFFQRNFGGRDLTAYNLPMEKSVHDAWSRGRLPVWQTEVSGGRPLLPNPNAGALYPLRLLLSPLRFPLAMRIYPIVHWIAAGIGVLVLCLALGRSRSAAWIGAVTYVFSGVGVGEVFYLHIEPGMALLPWIVWATQRKSGSSASRLLTLACLFGLDLLAADVFTIGLAIACAALWIAVEERSGAALPALGRLGLAVALAALAAAPQIFATAFWIPHTNRAVLGMKLSEVVLYSIHPWRLLELAVPYPFGPSWATSAREMWGWSIFRGRSMGLFPTIYAGAFAVVAVGIAWRSRERGARFARTLLVLVLAAAVIPSLLPAPWANVASPLPLRNPEKFAVALVFALALLSAVAFDAWRVRPRRLRWAIAGGGLMAAIALGCAARPDAAARIALALTRGDPGLAAGAARHLAAAFSEAGLLWMATVAALDGLGRRRAGLIAAVVVLTVVPLVANRRIARSFREEEIFAPTAFARYVARRDPEGAYRTLDEGLFRGGSALEESQLDAALFDISFSRRNWYQLTPTLLGRGTVFNQDFDSGDLSRMDSLRKVAALASGFRDSDALFGATALRFGIRFRDQEALAGYRPIGGDALQVWDEHPAAYPDIRLLERWLEVPGPVQALESLGRLATGEIVIEDGASQKGAALPGRIRVLERSAERFVIDLDAVDACWLFVLRAYWPYRSIRLDKTSVEAVPAQLAYCAVPIPRGHHRLFWEERVPGLRLSRWGPILFGTIAAGLVVAHARRRKK